MKRHRIFIIALIAACLTGWGLGTAGMAGGHSGTQEISRMTGGWVQAASHVSGSSAEIQRTEDRDSVWAPAERDIVKVVTPLSITAGVPTRLTFTVIVRNVSGASIIDPLISDNGRFLDNRQAVKTGGNQDNVLEPGETWTWTSQETVIGTAGEDIVNTATFHSPDYPTRELVDPVNITASAVVVVNPPEDYDLEITKTVTVHPERE